MKPNSKFIYDHAVRFRPKGYSTKVWEYCVSEAILSKCWALRIFEDSRPFKKVASEISIVMFGECLHKSVIDLAKDSYDYFKMRAFGQTFIGALDPSARKRWESITHRKVPKPQYWCYDHRNPNAAYELKFDVKRGYGWIKKSKKELKQSKGA